MNKTRRVPKSSRFLLSVSLAAGLLLPAYARAEGPLNDLFQKGKTETKMGSYQSSLATFQKLDELSLQPGNEQARVKLEPLIAFYRGVNLAALGDKDAARKEFEIYLVAFPAAHLDPAMFPKAAVEVFNKTRDSAPRTAGGKELQIDDASPIAYEYARFKPDPNAPAVFDEKWAQGAIRFLMTKTELDSWQRIQDSQQRAEFVTTFWQRRDPNPLTPENEFRQEIERRIKFADSRFTVAEERGSASDRGLVFVLLGPPSYIAQRPLMSGDDSIQAARNAPTAETSFDRQGRKVVQYVPRDPLTTETLQGTREIWYYRRDRLPKAVPFPEVDFEFLTKKGVGNAVLQREHDILTTLDLAARATLPSGKETSN